MPEHRRQGGHACLFFPLPWVIGVTQCKEEVGKESNSAKTGNHPQGEQALLGITSERRQLPFVSVCSGTEKLEWVQNDCKKQNHKETDMTL